MRDIRPIQPMSHKEAEEPLEGHDERQEKELYEVSQEIKEKAELPQKTVRPRFAGAKVPVAKIPVPGEAQQIHSDVDHRYEKKRPLFLKKSFKKAGKVRVGRQERRMLLIFFGLVVAAGVIAGVIFLPTATAVLRLRTAPLLVDEQLVIGTAGEAAEAVVPGTAFWREVTMTGSAPVQNMETVGEKATGTVDIVNRATEVQRLLERSRLVTADGQLFYMQKHAIVPPNSRVSVSVEADLAGESSNIEPQRLDFAALDEASQQLVYAEATKALTGGSGEEISVVGEEDINQAKRTAGEQARSQAESEIRVELPEGWVILEESWTGEVVSFDAEAAVGDKTPEFGYKAKIAVRVMGFEQKVLEEHLKTTLEERLDDDYMLFPGPIAYTKSVSNVDWDKGQLKLAVRVTHTTIPSLSLDTLRDKLAGRSVEEAKEYLEGLSGVRSASIELWPFWARSVPRIEQRISLELEPEKQP